MTRTPPTMLLTPDSTDDLDAVLRRRLNAVEKRFKAELLSDLPCVNDLAGHVERYRGKMLRPMLTVLASMAGGGAAAQEPEVAQRVDLLATVFEMVHMSTLVHDDVLDEADVRRGGQTVNCLHGNEAAVMLGDYLISHSYHLCCALDDAAVARAVAATTNTICEGELLQLSHRGDFAIAPPVYFEIIRRKTAALCAACCRLPAAVVGPAVSASAAEALSDYGEKVGVAFQIIDDVLDLIGDEATVGKTLGRDLAKGKMTLPLIDWVDGETGPARDAAVAMLESAAAGGETPALREKIREAGAIDRAGQAAQGLVADACSRLTDGVPDSPARQRLLDLAAALLQRQH